MVGDGRFHGVIRGYGHGHGFMLFVFTRLRAVLESVRDLIFLVQDERSTLDRLLGGIKRLLVAEIDRLEPLLL